MIVGWTEDDAQESGWHEAAAALWINTNRRGLWGISVPWRENYEASALVCSRAPHVLPVSSDLCGRRHYLYQLELRGRSGCPAVSKSIADLLVTRATTGTDSLSGLSQT